MSRLLSLFGCCLLLAFSACSGASSPPAPAGPGAPSADLLPAVHTLDVIRATSDTFASLTVLDSDNANIGAGHLLMNAPVNGAAWMIFDLGVKPVDFTIGSVDFPTADWTALDPLPDCFIGVANYSTGRWVFRRRPAQGGPADFNDLPNGTNFRSPGNHAYVAVVTTYNGLDCGTEITISGSAGPGGDLPAEYILNFPTLPVNAGRNNAIIIRPDGTRADLLTYSSSSGGGSLLRFGYDPAADTYTMNVVNLWDFGQALQNCHSYRPLYSADGRLEMGAARRLPNGIRYVQEDAVNSGSFIFDSKINNFDLPANFDDPQFSWQVDGQGDSHCIFINNNGKLAYYGIIAGIGSITSESTIDALGSVNMLMQGTTMTMTYQFETGGTRVLALRQAENIDNNDIVNFDFGTGNNVYNVGGTEGALSASLVRGQGNSLMVAHQISTAANDQLGFAYNASGILMDTWTNNTADNGGGTADVGLRPSVAFLRDGTPVVVYHDATNLNLKLAISSTPDGGNVTGATWDTYNIDESQSGNIVGLNPALGVLPRSGANPDKLIIGYGVQTGASTTLRVALLNAPAPAT